ncbi:membrane protein [Beggiatoa sp. PS]|nr:membrane protein [Beggiatoa sp. PS]
MISFWSELMGRRRKNSFLDNFIKTLDVIVSSPLGYIIGGFLTLFLLGVSELWLAPPSPEELGLYAPAIENFTKIYQWFFRCLAICSFIATLVSFYKNQ